MSHPRSRQKREPPDRSGPDRSPLVPAAASELGVPPARELSDIERLTATSNAVMQGAVEHGVKTAYTVIEEYIRRGREAAARVNPNWRGDMDSNRYNYSNPNIACGPMWPLVAPWVQMIQAWTCAMGAFVPGAAPPQPWNPYSTRDSACCAQPAATGPKVSVRVNSQYPTEVQASIDSGADAMPLTADPLKASDEEDHPPLRSVAIKCERGHVHVHITVPTDQPAGRYAGAIRDAAGCKRGELALEIGNPEARTASPRAPRKSRR
jgi:hypothetical protein